MIPFQLLSYVLYVSAILLLLYRVLWKEASNLYALAVAVIAAFLLFGFEHAQIPLMLSGIVIFNSVSFTQERKVGMLVALLGIAYAALYLYYAANVALLSQAIFIGLVANPDNFRPSSASKDNKEVEKRRDVLQAAFGVAIVAAFVLLRNSTAYVLLILLILLGYLLRSFVLAFGKNALSKYILGLEREGAPFGKGAAWLAMGALLALSFVSPVNLVVVVLAAILVADPLATIVGIRMGGIRLPYNKGKTLYGFLAYFLVVFAVSFFLARQLSVFIALLAAIVESLPMHIDDNFDVPLVLAVVLKLAAL